MGGVYSTGGTTRTALSLAGYLSNHYDVEVVSVNRGRRVPHLPFPPGVKVTALDDRFVDQSLRWRLGRRVLSRVPSLLINVDDSRFASFSLWSDLLILRHLRRVSGVLIATRPGLNILAARFAPADVRTIGQEHMNLGAHRPLLRAAISRYYPGLDTLAVLTESDLRDYTALFTGGRPPVVRRPNAVPTIDGRAGDPESKVVVAVGRLTPQKGFDLLLPAWVPIAHSHPDWQLKIYGAGPEKALLEAQIADLGLGGQVALMGRTSRIGEAYASGSIFVLSSRREGLPMVILEAMSKGLPVVSFDCPTGPAEMVATGENGVLVRNGDVPALTEGLSELIEDRALRARLGRGALGTAARYDQEAIGKEWVELIDGLISTPAGGGSPSQV